MNRTIGWMLTIMTTVCNNGGTVAWAVPHGNRPGMQIILGTGQGMLSARDL